MCLYACTNKPLVSDKPITVYKELYKSGECFFTPYQHQKVKLGENMAADGELPEFQSDDYYNAIFGGMVHSYIKLYKYAMNKEESIYVKATIKPGTLFYVSFNGIAIASRELKLDGSYKDHRLHFDEMEHELKETREIIYNLLREQQVSKDGIRVGDVLLSDKAYCKPEEVRGGMIPIGMVAFMDNGKPYVISIEQSIKEWTTSKYKNISIATHRADIAMQDFDGRERTDVLVRNCGGKLEGFPALEYCVKYETVGTKEGDWYLPSCKEMRNATRNMMVINMSLDMLGYNTRKFRIVPYNDYWTSVEVYDGSAWICDTTDAECRYAMKGEGNYVRPFLNVN